MYYCRGGKKHVVWGMHGTIAGRVFYHIILLRYSVNNMSYHACVSYLYVLPCAILYLVAEEYEEAVLWSVV